MSNSGYDIDGKARARRAGFLMGIGSLIVFGLVALFDWKLFRTFGGLATLSTQFGKWLSHGPVLGFVVGGLLVGLVVHFYRMMPADTPMDQRIWVLIGMVTGGVVLWLITPQ